MAATPSKELSASSPKQEASQQQPPQTEAASFKKTADDEEEKKPSVAAASSSSATATPPLRLTYESTVDAPLYQAAVRLLRDGALAEALDAIESGISEWTNLLLRQLEQAGGDGEDAPTTARDTTEVEFHESLAPWQYLYGTTLLYQIEEGAESDGMIGGDGDPSTAGVMIPAATAASAASEGAGNEGYGDNDEADNDDDEEEVDDKQIVWENLESARTILERLLQERENQRVLDSGEATSSSSSASTLDRLRIDLAQVRLREGDLNRMNGLHAAAATDYQQALECLQSTTTPHLRIGPYDRKLADLHYNLGQAYLLQAAEAAAASTATPTPECGAAIGLLPPPPPTSNSLSSLRGRGVYHLWHCSRALAGRAMASASILMGCLLPPHGPDDDRHDDPAQSLLDRAERAVDGLKRTDDDRHKDIDGEEEHPAVVGRKLQVLRAELSQIVVPPNDQGPHDDDATATATAEVHELLQLLEEIQETIDEAEQAEQGLRQVTELKAEISAAVAASASSGGGTGGLDAASSSSGAAAATSATGGGGGWVGLGSAAAAASTAAAQPIAAKKKQPKKRDATAADLSEAGPPLHGAKKPPGMSSE